MKQRKKPSAAAVPRKRAMSSTAKVAAAVNIPASRGGKDDIEKLPSPPEVKTEGGIERRAKQGANALTCYVFRDGKCETDVALKGIPRLARDDRNMAWLDLSEYAEADLQEVAEALNLHALTVKATLSDWERPRVDLFPDYFYMSVTVVRADQAKRKVVAGELNIVVGRNFLLTAHKLPLPIGEKILERLKQSPEVATMHTAFALYIVLDELVEMFQGIFEHIDEEIEEAEEHALTQSSDAFLSDLLALKRYIFVLGRFAEQHRSVFAVLTRPDFTYIEGQHVEPYFRELQENLSHLIDKLSGARDSVTEAFEIYISQVSHRTNELIRVLTLISTVVLPATLVVGFFSTNFTKVTVLGSTAAFWVMIVLLFALPSSILLFIRRRHLV